MRPLNASFKLWHICEQTLPGQVKRVIPPSTTECPFSQWGGCSSPVQPLWYVLLPAEVEGNKALVCSINGQRRGLNIHNPAKVNTREAPSPQNHHHNVTLHPLSSSRTAGEQSRHWYDSTHRNTEQHSQITEGMCWSTRLMPLVKKRHGSVCTYGYVL